jgi:hypothetical protein
MEAVEEYKVTGKRGKKTINTKNILFIMSGAFDGLDEIVRKRCQKQTMGFEGTLSSAKDSMNFLKKVMAEDLVVFGFESEFIGRLPIVAVLASLTEEDFYQILRSPNCPVVLAKKQDFRVYGINLFFTDEAYREIARQSIQEKTGARGLVSVVERVLLPFEKKLPSTEITSLCVGVETVIDPEKEIAQLLGSIDALKRHEEQCKEVAVAERERLVQFISQSKTVALRNQGVTGTDKKLQLIATISQRENMEITDACQIIVEFVQRIKSWETKISAECDITVSFEEDTIDKILDQESLTIENIDTMCRKLLTALEYGLRLMTHKKHITDVRIPAHGVEKPEQFINELVEKTFKG